MSKLYLKATSDTKKQVTSTGNKNLTSDFYYGSAKDSKMAGRVSIEDKGEFFQFKVFDKEGKIKHQQVFSK